MKVTYEWWINGQLCRSLTGEIQSSADLSRLRGVLAKIHPAMGRRIAHAQSLA
jgi:hypothetical protein